MLNYSDVQLLREKGQSNRQILELLATGVPSAKKAINDIDADTATPDWMKESKIGKMLDAKVPKNAPSGMGYAMAVGLNEAQKTYDEKKPLQNVFQKANQGVRDVMKQETGLPGFLGRVGGRMEKAWGNVLERTEEFHSGDRGFVDTIIPNASNLFSAAVSPVVELGSTVANGVLEKTGLDEAIAKQLPKVPEKIAGSIPVAGPILKQTGLDKVVGDAAVEKGGEIYNSIEGAAPQELDALKSTGKAILDAGDVVGAAQIANTSAKLLKKTGEKALQKSAQVATNLAKNDFDEVVKIGMDKGAKPQFRGAIRSSPQAQKEYYQNASQAVKNIIDESPSLKYFDEAGDIVSEGHVPRNLNEFLQAIPQVKKSIFERFSAASAEATGKGAKVDLDDLVDKLIEYADDPVKQLADKSKTEYALKMAEQLMKQKQLTPTQTESLIKELNQSLARAYEGKSAKGISEVDISIASFLRENLDDVVMQTTDENYQALKNAYGSLKAIEKDVAHQALKVARGNSKGLIDLTDIFTGGDIVAGAVSGNPALLLKGIAGKGTQLWYKNLVSPDANIMRMFNKAQKSLRSGVIDTQILPPVLAQ